jgi:hypothetical protein
MFQRLPSGLFVENQSELHSQDSSRVGRCLQLIHEPTRWRYLLYISIIGDVIKYKRMARETFGSVFYPCLLVVPIYLGNLNYLDWSGSHSPAPFDMPKPCQDPLSTLSSLISLPSLPLLCELVRRLIY